MPKADSGYTTIARDWRPPDPWLPQAERRRIIYRWMRKATTWPAWLAWRASLRWMEDTAS